VAEQIYVVEAVAYTSAGTETLYWCSGKGFTTKTTDTPASTPIAPRIIEPANLARLVFGDGRTAGRSQVGGGELVLNNADGGLNALLDYGLDGRAISIWVGEQGAAYPSGFARVFRGTMEQPEVSATRAVVRLRDRQAELDRPIQTTKFAGTNSGATGVEGTADDLKGRPKPLAYGRCYNVAPPQVNASLLIYQVHDGAVQAIDAVYDGGLAYTLAGDDPDLATLQAATVAAGDYRTCLAEGYFRLGTLPAGLVTADVQGDATGSYVSSVAGIVERIVTTRGGLASGDVDAAAVAALNTANSAVVGIWVDQERSILDVLDELCASIGAYYYFDTAGDLVLGRLDAPASPSVTLTDVEIIAIERQATRDQGRGLPAYRVILGWQRNWTVQDDVLGAVSEARKAWLAEAVRTVTATDVSVQTKHPLAPELRRDTLLAVSSAASAEATRLQALYGVRRDMVRCRVRLDATNAAIDLGDVVRVQTSRLGYSAGRDFVVLGVETTGARNRMTLTLWG